MSRYFGRAHHSGFVVPDVDRAIERMLASGVGPVYVMRNIRARARYRGERHDVFLTAAIAYSGGLQCEFVEQHDDAPSAYREFLARHPDGGLHHLAYSCTSFAEALRIAQARGQSFTTVQEFISPEGVAFELYLEPTGAPDPLLTQLIIPGPLDHMYAQMEKEAAVWDGSAPVRNALDLLPKEFRPGTEG